MKAFFVSLFLLSAVLVPASASHAAYPEKPIQLVVAWAPGGGNDVSARVMAEYVNKHLAQPIIISNVTGGAGSVGAQQVLRAKPDGYTLFWEQPTMSCSTATGTIKHSYKDFDMINVVLNSTAVMACSKNLPCRTAPELMQYETIAQRQT